MTLNYILIAVLVLFSALFSSSEIAYTSVNKMRLEKMAEEGKRTAKLALYITNHYERMLSGILVGNNLVNIAASSVSTVIVLALLGDIIGTGASGTVATFAITVIILIFGEIAPKMYAKQKSLSFACLVAYPIFFIMMLFLPVTAIVTGIVNLLSRMWKPKEEAPTVTEEELQSIIETAEEEEVLDEESSELLQSALSFPDTTVEDILVHRTNVKMLDVDDPYEENLREIMESRHSRLLVYEDTVDHVIGILSLNRFFKALASVENSEVDIRAQLLEPCYVHKTLKLHAALSAMRRAKMQIAVVLDEYGGTLGIVTVE
ncbi:MAG: HlyC/CorC family transporter, partial [Clostridia bacterium]|nr:HlyC/CorC family transporter [Clostridia bacterium]